MLASIRNLVRGCNTRLPLIGSSSSSSSIVSSSIRQVSLSTSTSTTSGLASSTPATAGVETGALYRYLIPGELLKSSSSKPVERMLSLQNGDASERKQAAKRLRIEQLGMCAGDTGSTPVQVACLSVRIDHIKEHCQTFKQDKASKRAYTMLLTRRRKLLQYLRRKDFAAYEKTLKELKIKGFS